MVMITKKKITISVAQAVVYRTQKCLYGGDHELTIIIISSRNLSRDVSMWENVINLKYYYTGNDCKDKQCHPKVDKNFKHFYAAT